MASSKIIITFTDDLVVNDQFGFRLQLTTTVLNQTQTVADATHHRFRWVALRNGAEEVSITTATNIPGESTAINFYNAAIIDLQGMLVTRNLNVVTIEYVVSENPVLGTVTTGEFITPAFTANLLQSYAEIGNYTYIIENVNYSPISITDISYVAHPEFCTKVFIDVTTFSLATIIEQPIQVNPNTDNPIRLESNRGVSLSFIAQNASGQRIEQSILAPALLNINNFSTQVISTPFGANVVVNNTYDVNTSKLTFEYSIDQINWRANNVFTALTDGDYTLYIRDQFACTVSTTFNIANSIQFLPYSYVSKANSLIFADRVIFGDSANYKNDENTLSCEVDEKLAYEEIQLFQTSDIIKTQFKSNYQSNIFRIKSTNGNDSVGTPVKMSNNMGLKDKRDAIRYDLGNGKTGIYFVSGNIYNFDTGIQEGTYALNGLLPQWAKGGNYVSVDGTWFLIEGIIFDETKEADVIVFENTYTNSDVPIIVASTYSLFNYEVYEFDIDMADYLNDDFRVEIECSTPTYTIKKYWSEKINVKVRQLETVEIKYSQKYNTDILYSTGIVNLIRIPYTKIKGAMIDSSDNYKTDTSAILIEATIYEGDEYTFRPLTKELWKKVQFALSSNILTIDNVNRVKEGDFSSEAALGFSNLYILTATMVKASGVFVSENTGQDEFNISNTEIVGLVQTQADFVKYQ